MSRVVEVWTDGEHSVNPLLRRLHNSFFDACIDQVDFMSNLMQPNRLRDRVMTWAREEIVGG